MLKRFTRALAHVMTAALLLGMLIAMPQAAGAALLVSGVPAGLTVGGKVYFGAYPQSVYTPTSPPGAPTEGTVYTDTDSTKFCYSANTNRYYKMEPIEWRVLANGSGGLLLLSEKNLDTGKGYHDSNVAITWEHSAMRAFLNNRTALNPYPYSFIELAFNTAEQAAIPWVTVDNPNNPDYGTPGGNATQDQLFLLSIQEAGSAALGFSANSDRVAINTAYTASFPNMYVAGHSDWWWLRSPGISALNAAYVYDTGRIYSDGNSVFTDFIAIRPAFHVHPPSVLFTSAAAGGKSGGVGVALSAAQPLTGAVKLTVLDSGLSLSSSATVGTVKAGDTVSIPYIGAATGANRTVSCVIEDSGGAVLFYGKLVDCTSGNANGTASFTVPAAASLPNGSYTVKLFNEECNADNYTDFASAPVSLPMTVGHGLRPPSVLPQTGDGFPMGALLALMGVCLAGMGFRMRGRRTKA